MPFQSLRAVIAALMCVAATALASCGVLDRDELFLRPSQYDERTTHVPVAVSKAWVAAPGIRSIYMRPIFDGYEQRLTLDNPTLLPGDNMLILRARDNIVPEARLKFEEFTTWTGGLPVPFTNLNSGSLTRGEDELGPYYYAVYRGGVDTICVFGIRRLTTAARKIPVSGDVMDVQLRNCQRNGAEAALAPLLASSLQSGFSATQPNGKSRLLSPLAGPDQ